MQNAIFDRLKSLVALVEHVPAMENYDLGSQCSILNYNIEETPYYVIARHKDHPVFKCNANVEVLLRSPKNKVPLAFNLYFLDRQLIELELFLLDSSSIDYGSFWYDNHNLLPEVTWEIWSREIKL